MPVRRNYRINLRNYGNPPAIMVSQYDENYDLVFEVYDGVVPATGLNAYTVKLVGRQPGNDPALKYEFTGTVSGIANNILSFTIDTTMTGRAGKGTAEIVILDTTNDVKFASFNLPVYVEKAAVPDDAIDADVERAQEIADEVQDIVDTAAAEVKGEAEAWAVGERDGEPVPSTDPTYHNNAKYYAEQAQDIADSIGIDATLSISGKAADAKKTGDEISSLKEDLNDLSAFVKHTVTDGKMVRASDGVLVSSSPYKAHEYPVYGLTKLYLTPNFTNATYGFAFYDKSKNFISNSGGTYDVATRTEITVPNGAYYIRFTENTAYSKPIIDAEWGLLIETKTAIQETKDHSAEVYSDMYVSINYVPTDGLSVVGKYYDTTGALQSASNMSTTGIIDVPYGIKDIYYNAYRNTIIPTILFFDSSMQIVGTVIATTAPVYGDTSYSGYADIPSTAKYMECSMSNTISDQIVTVRYSKADNNLERIKILETDPLYGKKIACTGDSITSAIHSVPYNGYVAQIANAHGMTIDNQAIWGAVFPQNKTSGGEPRGCIYDTIALMDASADIVIISGGINDAEYYASDSYWGSVTGDYDDTLDTETFCGALEAICKEALQKWSGKPIIFVFEHRMTLDNTTYGAHFNDVQYPLMVEILEKWGIPYVDLYHEMPSLSYNEGYKTAYTTGDGVHPNYDGYAKFYVPRVYSKIKEVMGI